MATNYRELIVWQKAMALAEATYTIAGLLPDIERFSLSMQMRRAAVSIASNIAEGHERRSRAEYRRFIAIACGSLAELETQFELAQRLYPLGAAAMMRAAHLADETGRLLRSIERALRKSVVEEQSISYDIIQPPALSPQPRNETIPGSAAGRARQRGRKVGPHRHRHLVGIRAADAFRSWPWVSHGHDEETAHQIHHPRIALVPARRDQCPLPAGTWCRHLG